MRAPLLLALLLACDAPPPGLQQYDTRQLSERSKNALRMQGIRDAKRADYLYFVCGNDDSIMASEGFIAGDIRGNVCCGFLKGCTVRTQ